VSGTVRIADAPGGSRVRLAGEVRSVVLRPDTPRPDIEAVLFDGTGEVRLVWTGRESIEGLAPLSRLVVEGVLEMEGDERRMVDPDFEIVFVPPEVKPTP
jgi:hypothetical protein